MDHGTKKTDTKEEPADPGPMALLPAEDMRETLKTFMAEIRSFTKEYKGRVDKLSGAELATAITAYENLIDVLARIDIIDDITQKKNLHKTTQTIEQQISFFPHQVCAMHEKTLMAKFQQGGLTEKLPWIARIREKKDHQLSEQANILVQQQRPAAQMAWQALYDCTDKKDERLHVRIFNTVAALNNMLDEQQEYETPQARYHILHRMETGTAETLVKTVRHHASRTTHRFYNWQQKSGFSIDDKDQITKTSGPDILAAVKTFSPVLAKTVETLLDENWVASRHDGAPSFLSDIYPYARLDKDAPKADLARILGENAQIALGQTQGPMMAKSTAPLNTAAGILVEILFFHHQTRQAKKPATRKKIMVTHMTRMLEGITGQIADCLFEKEIHEDVAKKGVLESKDLAKAWQKAYTASYGTKAPKIHSWQNNDSFIHAPFSGYAEAAGHITAYMIHDAWQEAKDKTAFAEKVMDVFRAGGALRYEEALKKIGLEASEESFDKAMQSIAKNIDLIVAVRTERTKKMSHP